MYIYILFFVHNKNRYIYRLEIQFSFNKIDNFFYEREKLI